MQLKTVKAQFPAKLKFLFSPHRYKIARGGRGSAKSWSVARALLIQGKAEPLRIGCFREIQKSIKDSVHALLKDQVQLLGFGKDEDNSRPSTTLRSSRTLPGHG